MKRLGYFLALAPLALTMACGSDDDSEKGSLEDPAQHACEVFGDEGTHIAASEDPDSAPDMDPSETPYTIELVDGAPGFVNVHGGADALLMVGEKNVVTGLYHEDDPDTDLLSAGEPNEFCDDDIPEHFDLELEEPGHYHLQLGPSALDEVWVVFIGAEGHAHEGE